MKKKSSNLAFDAKNIELPLLSEQKSKKQSFIAKTKSHFISYFDPSSPPSKYIQKIPILKFITFFDVLPFIKLINTKPTEINISDLPLAYDFCNVNRKIVTLDAEWTLQLAKDKPSFINAVMKVFKKELLLLGLLGFILTTCKVVSSLLLGNIIREVTKGNFEGGMDQSYMLFLATLLGVASILFAFSNTWYWHLSGVVGAVMRNAITGFVYKKLQSVALSSLQEVNIGKVINLLSTDVNELDKGLIYLIPTFMSPYTIGVGVAIMWKYFGFFTIFGFLGLVSPLFLSSYISKKTQPTRSEKSIITDERVKLTNELIECIRLIKMYAWEKTFNQAIKVLREREVAKLFQLKIIGTIGESFAFNSTQTSLLIMCLMYALAGGILSSEKVYTSLMILNFTSLWGVYHSHSGMMFIAACRVMNKRIEDILFIKDIIEPEEILKKNSFAKRKDSIEYKDPYGSLNSLDSKMRPLAAFQNFSARWKKGDPKLCLNNIDLKLYSGQLTTVIGSIGAGKTTFLLSFLKEIPSTEGNLLFDGRVAYVEQEPTIFSGTVRSNILFGLEYNESLYKKVVRACCLLDDFKQLESGDLTIVGERGITLSGGQKARISLCRALYSQSDIYLLDDPLSAVDSRVGRHIFKYAIRGDLLQDKLVILVTHHLNYAKESDRVLLFSEGRIVADGKFEDVRMMESGLFDRFKEVEDKVEEKAPVRKSTTMKGESAFEERKDKDEKEEAVASGEEKDLPVTASTYLEYVRQGENYPYLIMNISIYLFYGCLLILFSRHMGFWGYMHTAAEEEMKRDGSYSDQEFNFDNTFYAFLAIGLTVLLVFFGIIKHIIMARFLFNANSNMHNKALERVTQAKVQFFDKTPIGTILNRFSNDLGILDTSNCYLFPGVFDGLIYIVLRIIVLIYLNVQLIIPIAIIFFLVGRARSFFQKPVVETKRLDLASKSPLYSEISVTINSLLTIRVFNQGGNFIRRFSSLLFDSMRASVYVDRTLRFFGYILNTSLECLTVAGTFVCIFVAYNTNLDAALFGLNLTMLQEIGGFANFVIRTSLLVDVNMQSVNRLTKYYELPTEAPQFIETKDNPLKANPQSWPLNGKITFNNVYMKYRPEFDYVLKGLTFTIPPGHKVGVVGRTGAGKSSILQTLFRMTEIEKMPGSEIIIDDIDISSIGLNLLRRNLSIIPQTPVVFTGKIRRNLDPFNEFTDFELWQALEEVSLRQNVEGLEKKLETDMTMSTSVFSAGQKQLICLARAILRKSKIIVLDEATANVDIETDDFIQRKIMEKFRYCTVITIAHRLITIANYDKVIVMDQGKVVEYDSPYKLLAENEGDEKITRRNSVFSQMVLNSGESMANKIFEIAMNKYYAD